ncbi:type IV pilus biogenesis protein PilM [Pseudothermotoga thermarum]|uniref:Tfp pilus assembly protein ATPase PilM-like protein n=1 Tax=Pseudothermotoga thermarum DSM 5069 TaxID=688269 RepID=F7YYE1_9THEM|nr:hypothetical protein [Pseudothermotoga thermarum]AEH50965.1 hypothetical protein Theth_0881 [Pseudothermotoga thermarum DSM 5069]
MQIFHKMITAVEFGNGYVNVGRAKKSRGRLIITSYFSQECAEQFSTAKSLLEKIGTDVEDIVVLNYPMDLLLFNTINVPGTLKEKQISNYATMEISHLLNVPPEELVVETVVGPVNKAVVAVAKRKELYSFLTRLRQAGIPEPDVVIPDVFKYLLLVRIPDPSTVALCAFSFDYSIVGIYISEKLVGLRTIPYSLQEVLNLIMEEIGFTKLELQSESSINNFEKVSKMVEALISDIPYVVERELIFLLSGLQIGVSIRDIAKIYLLCDPSFLTGTFVKAFESSEVFQGKVEKAQFKFETNNFPIGLAGMLVRGGAEFGKNKLVQIQKTGS